MHKRPVIGGWASVRMNLGRRLGLGVATFRPFQAVSAAEKIATIIDSIEFCTACHAEGRKFEPAARSGSLLTPSLRAIRRAHDLTAATARAPHNAVAGSKPTRPLFPAYCFVVIETRMAHRPVGALVHQTGDERRCPGRRTGCGDHRTARAGAAHFRSIRRPA
jgi:hypothetical protein